MKYSPALLAAVVPCLLPAASHAYIGPGAGLGAVGTAIAFLAAIVLLVVGFVWYPVKRILRRRRVAGDKTERVEEQEDVDKT